MPNKFPATVVAAYDAWIVTGSEADLEAFTRALESTWAVLPAGISGGTSIPDALRARFPQANGDAGFETLLTQVNSGTTPLSSSDGVRAFEEDRTRARSRWLVLAGVCFGATLIAWIVFSHAYLVPAAFIGAVDKPRVSLSEDATLTASTPLGTLDGQSSTNAIIEITVNGREMTRLRSSGQFSTQVGPLEPGPNSIRLRAVDSRGWLKGRPVDVTLIYEPVAEITVESPREGAETTKEEVTIRGKTVPDAQVAVAGRSATADDQGQFLITAPLILGDNALVLTTSKRGMTSGRANIAVRRCAPIATRSEIERFQATIESLSSEQAELYDDARELFSSVVEWEGVFTTQEAQLLPRLVAETEALEKRIPSKPPKGCPDVPFELSAYPALLSLKSANAGTWFLLQAVESIQDRDLVMCDAALDKVTKYLGDDPNQAVADMKAYVQDASSALEDALRFAPVSK